MGFQPFVCRLLVERSLELKNLLGPDPVADTPVCKLLLSFHLVAQKGILASLMPLGCHWKHQLPLSCGERGCFIRRFWLMACGELLLLLYLGWLFHTS